MYLCKQKLDAFLSGVKNIAKFSLERLQFGKTEPNEKSEVSSLVDVGLMRPLAGDGMNFIHRTFELFLGALYLILMLSDGESLDSLIGQGCKSPIFLTNSLFLYFCLSLLKE